MTGRMRDPFRAADFYTKDEIDALFAARTAVTVSTYTPTFTNVGANLANFAVAVPWKVVKLGSTYVVSGMVTYDATGVATGSSVDISCPDYIAALDSFSLDGMNTTAIGGATAYNQTAKAALQSTTTIRATFDLVAHAGVGFIAYVTFTFE